LTVILTHTDYGQTCFVKDTGLNAFRIPVAWQYLVDGVLGGKLDPERFGNYNRQIQGCINAGAALCMQALPYIS
jgi:endoglucanase